MWVDPAQRGRGLGGRLVDAVVEWAAANGAGTVVLSVKRANAAAIALYERCGFVRTTGGPPAPPDEQRMTRRAGPVRRPS
jgi:ribosomal protein S18 acetylase RimI-like enzyme